MPSEIRHILFEPSEVIRAVEGYHLRAGRPLPGPILKCEPEADDQGVRFRVFLDVDDEEIRSRPVMLDETAMAAALILACRDRRIPLPARALKSIGIFGNQIGLIATFNLGAGRQSVLDLLRAPPFRPT
jgi:hypothetical protein